MSRETPPAFLLYGRRRGRSLRAGRRELVERRLPELRIELPNDGRLDPRLLFPAPPSAVFLELGFGGGEHLAALAAIHPAIGMIGAEVFENGVAKLVSEIERRALANIRIFLGDGRMLAASLADRSIARACILFPDPWPKERHKKRRIIARPVLDELARILIDGGELRIATDIADYASVIGERLAAHPDFRAQGDGDGPWRVRPSDWPPTRYEQKALSAGRTPTYFEFVRCSRSI